jgi:hypothetical protein
MNARLDCAGTKDGLVDSFARAAGSVLLVNIYPEVSWLGTTSHVTIRKDWVTNVSLATFPNAFLQLAAPLHGYPNMSAYLWRVFEFVIGVAT